MIGQYYEREIWGDMIGPYYDRCTGDDGGERQRATRHRDVHDFPRRSPISSPVLLTLVFWASLPPVSQFVRALFHRQNFLSLAHYQLSGA